MQIFISKLSSLRTLWGAGEHNWVLSMSKKLVLGSILVSVALLLWRYPKLPPLIPLWYSKPWGADRLAHPLWLAILPIGSLVILIVNTIAARILTRDMLIFTQILAVTALLVSILSLVTMTKIMFLVS